MIRVYGKPSCEKCNKFKQKLPLLKLLKGKDWVEIDVSDLEQWWSDGRHEEARHSRAVLEMNDGDLPVVEFSDGVVMGYSAAIRSIKGGQR